MFGPSKKPARLGRWNGRRRSSRGEQPLWSQLWSRPVLLRLGLVYLSVLAITAVVYEWGNPFPYRLGDVKPYDVRARVSFELTDPVTRVEEGQVVEATPHPPTPPTVARYQSGVILVERNKPINEQQLTLLKE